MTDEILARSAAVDPSVRDLVSLLHERLGAPVRAFATAEHAVPFCLPAAAGEMDAKVAGGYLATFPVRAGDEELGRLEVILPAKPGDELGSDLAGCASIAALIFSRDLERGRAAQREALFDHIAHPIFVKDRRFRWVLLNQAFCDLVGWPREALLLRSDYDFFPKEQADYFRRKDIEMFESKHVVQIEDEPITDAAGVTHLLATTKVPLVAPDGQVTHLVGIIHDITRLKEVEGELQRKNEELAAEVKQRTVAGQRLDLLNRELEAFSYSVSHDLRAPLRSIDGFSAAVLEDHAQGLDEQGRDYLERVRANVQRMARIIDDILSLARVSRTELRIGRVDLGSLARETVARLREAEPLRKMEVEIAPGLEACGDPRLLGVALENLIGNAWKFTAREEAARIEVGVRAGEGGPIFFVRDNGAGFDMAYADKLFRPFSRLHRPEDFAGTGVGLATVQRIIHRHGGRIWAEAAPGRGATFFFTLAPAPVEAAPAATA